MCGVPYFRVPIHYITCPTLFHNPSQSSKKKSFHLAFFKFITNSFSSNKYITIFVDNMQFIHLSLSDIKKNIWQSCTYAFLKTSHSQRNLLKGLCVCFFYFFTQAGFLAAMQLMWVCGLRLASSKFIEYSTFNIIFDSKMLNIKCDKTCKMKTRTIYWLFTVYRCCTA